MKRFYRLFISLLVIVGIVAVAPATTVETKAEQCVTSAGSCGGDLVFADADIKKKKKKKGKKMTKGKKGKKGGAWGKWKSKWKKKSSN